MKTLKQIQKANAELLEIGQDSFFVDGKPVGSLQIQIPKIGSGWKPCPRGAILGNPCDGHDEQFFAA